MTVYEVLYQVREQRTVGQYRAIDLSLFALMVMVAETLLVTAATRWFPREASTVSVTAALTAIVMIRWGPWSAIHAFLGGLAFCLASGGSLRQFAIYCIGNELAMLLLLFVRKKGDEYIRSDALRSMAFGGTALLLMQAGRGAVSLLFGAGLAQAAGFFTTDSVSMVFTLTVMWIVRRLDGVFENQYHYLRRIQSEREREEGGYR